MTEPKYKYYNPLGTYEGDISYNNIGMLKNSIKNIDARFEDSKIQNTSHHIQLSIWSLTAGISIISLLLLLRQLNNK